MVRTLRISATFIRLNSNISFTSRDKVNREGTSTLLLRSIKMSMSSSSSTIAKGQCLRATQRVIFIWNLCGVYVEPCAKAAIEPEPVAVMPVQDLA
jgi:hypothetical protein